jgi:uncharacterized RDD family membrane protein YckC
VEQYQTGWQRLLAFFIDAFITEVARTAINALVWLHLGMVFNIFIAIAYSTVTVAYFIYMHARFGQTIGKFITRVRLVDISGRRISYNQAILRDIVPCLLLPITLWTSLYTVIHEEYPGFLVYRLAYQFAFLWLILELVTMMFNEQRRAIHDFIARTVVVRVP